MRELMRSPGDFTLPDMHGDAAVAAVAAARADIPIERLQH
jgi:hypothetical protein